MERGGFHGDQKLPKSSSGSGSSHSSNKHSGSGNAPNPNDVVVVREPEKYMPVANVVRIMRRILPKHAKISEDAKETMIECVSEYISFITSEANDRCKHEQRRTVTVNDILKAMKKLGFHDYIGPLIMFMDRYREAENNRMIPEPPSLELTAMEMENMGVAGFGLALPMGVALPVVTALPLGSALPVGHKEKVFGYLPDGSKITTFDPYAAYK